MKKRSPISQIMKIQVHVLWVKTDRTVESVSKSVLEIITCLRCFQLDIVGRLLMEKLLSGSGYLLLAAICASILKDNYTFLIPLD
jgi:hypothetical protein